MIKLNGSVIDFTSFPNKETCFKFKYDLVDGDFNEIIFKYENDSDLVKLMFLKGELDLTCPSADNLLIIAYMPYSRLDRFEEGVSFTLRHVMNFINGLNFKSIAVIEPHSDVTCGGLKNSIPFNLTEKLFKEAISTGELEFDVDKDFVCYPDATAHKRYSKMGNYRPVIGMKDRDFLTGHIKNLDLHLPWEVRELLLPLSKKHVIIVDDLCSKGGTFIMTAKKLKLFGAAKVSLVVAHCEQTILEGEIFKSDLIDKVITSNTIINQDMVDGIEKIHVANFEDFVK